MSLCAHRLLIGAALSLGLAAVANMASAREKVALKFAWPDGLRATVTFMTRTKRKSAVRETQAATYGTYDLATRTRRRDLLVMYDNFHVKVKATGPNAVQTRIMGRLASVQPDFLIDGTGQFVRPVNLDRFRRQVETVIDRSLAELPANLRQRSQNFKRKATRHLVRRIQTQLKNQWDLVVGVLIDLELSQGRQIVRKIAQPVPLLNNASIPVTATVEFVRRARCGEDDPYRRCVEIVTDAWTDPHAVDRVARRISDHVAVSGGRGTEVRKYDMRQWTRVLVEPATLVVHRVHVKKTVTASMVHGKRIENTVTVTDSKAAYRY